MGRTYTAKGATLSDDKLYRYDLTRQWEDRADPDTVVFIGLNPSTADALEDDPTIRKCVEFTSRLGGQRLVMINLFAFRATDPAELQRQHDRGVDIIGPDTNQIILEWVAQAHRVILGWGVHGTLNGRDKQVTAMLPRVGKVSCLKRTKDGHPGHPLYISYATQIIPLF